MGSVEFAYFELCGARGLVGVGLGLLAGSEDEFAVGGHDSIVDGGRFG